MVITTPAGPSDARGSVAIVLPHLPSICRRSIFNELPASPRPSLPTMPPVLLLSLPLDNSVLLTHLHRLAHIVDLAAQPPDREFTASVTSALMKPSPSYNINASRDYEHIISTAQAYRCPNTGNFGKPRGQPQGYLVRVLYAKSGKEAESRYQKKPPRAQIILTFWAAKAKRQQRDM